MTDTAQLVRMEMDRRPPSPRIARAVREQARVSQATLATLVGVHRVTIARWETAKRRPTGPQADRYRAALKALQEATDAS